MKRLYFIAFLLLATTRIFAQSTSQNFPTPILQNEIVGTIAARDVGDSRITSHFYTFYANNGDLLLEIETANLNGDIDLFLVDEDLRPLSKIPLYADDANKIQSSVYLRKRERVVLRVEGRTPNDDAASYKIKISGGFEAATDMPKPPEGVETKAVASNNEAVAKVNSVGTIIEKPRKIEPTPKPEPIRRTTTAKTAKTTKQKPETEIPARDETAEIPKTKEDKVNEVTKESTKAESKPAKTPAIFGNKKPRTTKPTNKKPTKTAPNEDSNANETAPNPLANVRFVLLLKDGYKIERPMTEVLRVNVDKTTITVITKDGKIERFDILDVAKMSIE